MIDGMTVFWHAVQNMVNGIVEKTRSHINPASLESIVPDAPLRTISAHEGGAYTLAFDRYSNSGFLGRLCSSCTKPALLAQVQSSVQCKVIRAGPSSGTSLPHLVA